MQACPSADPLTPFTDLSRAAAILLVVVSLIQQLLDDLKDLEVVAPCSDEVPDDAPRLVAAIMLLLLLLLQARRCQSCADAMRDARGWGCLLVDGIEGHDGCTLCHALLQCVAAPPHTHISAMPNN